jgi:hypothetical protein
VVVGGVFSAEAQTVIIIVDFPEKMHISEHNPTKIMLAVWVVVLGEVIKFRNGAEQFLAGDIGQFLHPLRHHHLATPECLPKPIIQRRSTLGFIHYLLHLSSIKTVGYCL